MTEANTRPDTAALTPEGPLLYPNLLTPRAYQPKGQAAKGEPRYDSSIMFPATAAEVPAIRKAILAAVKKQWPTRTDFNGIKWPLVDGDKHAAALVAKGKAPDTVNLYKGNLILKAHALAKRKPEIIDRANNTVTDPNAIYGGVIARLSVNFKAGEIGGDHVTAYINHVLIVRAGERIGGVSAKNAFGDLVDGGSDTQVGAEGTALDDDSIPF